MTRQEVEARRQVEVQERRKRFRASVQNDPELRKELIIGLQWASPAMWEKMVREN